MLLLNCIICLSAIWMTATTSALGGQLSSGYPIWYGINKNSELHSEQIPNAAKSTSSFV